MLSAIERGLKGPRQHARHEFAIWKYLRHLPLEIRPLVDPPEIVCMQKSASQQVFAQTGGLSIAQQPLSWLDNIEVRKIEDLRIHYCHRMRRLTIGFDVRQPF